MSSELRCSTSRHEKSLSQMCDPSCDPKGYVLNCGEVIENQTIAQAHNITVCNMLQCIGAINCRWKQCGKEVTQIYIGKSYIRKKMLKPNFNPKDCSTWKLDGGVNGRYRDHTKKYNIRGLVVVAVVTEDSIPQYWKAAGYIINPEEYALMLEKCLIETFKTCYPATLLNKTTCPGRQDTNKSEGYVIYLAFTTGCFIDINWWGPGLTAFGYTIKVNDPCKYDDYGDDDDVATWISGLPIGIIPWA